MYVGAVEELGVVSSGALAQPGAVTDVSTAASSSQSMETAGAGFGDWMVRQMDAVNAQLMSAEHGVRQVSLGDASNLHGVMIQLEEARLSFQLLSQVRTRVLEAYQEVLRMQV